MKSKRPLPVTIVAWVYIVVGAGSFVAGLNVANAFQLDDVLVELVRFLAIICGACMLRGHGWARWLAVTWMAFHVIVSAFHSVGEVAIHSLFFAVIAWYLFRPEAGRYFRGDPI